MGLEQSLRMIRDSLLRRIECGVSMMENMDAPMVMEYFAWGGSEGMD